MAKKNRKNSSNCLTPEGIVRGNDPFLYGENLKAHLIRGAKSLVNERVPSERQGWGTLCVTESLRGE